VAKTRQALRDKKLVIIFGAGVSLSVTHPASWRVTWTRLICDGLDYLKEEMFLLADDR
jgi:hypothetical protein